MKIIIAGAGIGGMALAALLRQRGVTVELYERAPNFDRSGYMLGLWPVGARVLHGLGLMDDFLAASQPMDTYTVCNGGRVREHFAELGAGVGDILSALPDDLSDVFWWRLSDFRSENWTKGRVALLGDAACAFLPTAGVGASIALESAAVLDDELGRTDSKFLAGALRHYAQRRKKRAETFQQDSRKLASMMTVDSVPLAWGRDQLMKFYTLDMLARNIVKSLADPI